MTKLNQQDALGFFMRASQTLSQVEANGIRVDMGYLNDAIARTMKSIKDMERELKESKLYFRWKSIYGQKAKLGSRPQLSHMIFGSKAQGGLGLPSPTEVTDRGNVKADKDAFEHVDHPFVKTYFEIEKLRKVYTTYLMGILREVDSNGYLHPVFNNHLVATYRLSCSDPNFQNMPIRDPVMGEIIRRCFIPREGHHFGELDYVALEVRIAACYHKDPAMLRYIQDKTTDMHRDMAMQIYKLTLDEVNKMSRFAAKSYFVFAQFYGDYYVHCAKGLWKAIDRLNLKVGDTPMKEHLKKKGIKVLGTCSPDVEARPGTFEYHIKKVEEDFWGKRFAVYSEWKKSWVERYRRRGHFDTFTGFRISGYHKRNDIINYGTQCDASQCTLWATVELNRWLRKNKMRTKIIAIIHDSIVADIHKDEAQDYLNEARKVMTVNLPRQWDWINVPLEIEAELSPVNRSWFDKEEWVIKDDQNGQSHWGPKPKKAA